VNDKAKILMIDDSKIMHVVVQARLAADGLDFHSAYSGEEGIALAKALDPDLILLDIEMPSPNGFEVCRRLKDLPAVANIPVIFLSGLSSSDEKVHGLNLGAIDYITKPFEAAELQARVRASLRNKELLDLLSKKAMIDGLTGMYNRGYFDQRLLEEIAFATRHHRPLSCVMIDIDHFKTVNDTYGHGYGDLVLKGVASAIQRTCRSEDILCRYGGEEFAMLSRETQSESALALAARLLIVVQNEKFTRGNITVSVTCSIGVAEFTLGDDSLVEQADIALYASKRDGRNRATFFSEAVPLVGEH
jgi:two-component system cell cycle response regulator